MRGLECSIDDDPDGAAAGLQDLPETTRWKQSGCSNLSSGSLAQYIFPTNDPCYQKFQLEKTGARKEV
jgi:hypothetical protein